MDVGNEIEIVIITYKIKSEMIDIDFFFFVIVLIINELFFIINRDMMEFFVFRKD